MEEFEPWKEQISQWGRLAVEHLRQVPPTQLYAAAAVAVFTTLLLLSSEIFFFFSVMNKFVNFIVIFCSTLLYVRCDGFVLLCVCSKVVQACKVKHYCVDRA